MTKARPSGGSQRRVDACLMTYFAGTPGPPAPMPGLMAMGVWGHDPRLVARRACDRGGDGISGGRSAGRWRGRWRRRSGASFAKSSVDGGC